MEELKISYFVDREIAERVKELGEKKFIRRIQKLEKNLHFPTGDIEKMKEGYLFFFTRGKKGIPYNFGRSEKWEKNI